MAVIPRRIYRTVEWHLHNVPSALAEGDALSESLREAILSQQLPSGITLSGGHGGGHSDRVASLGTQLAQRGHNQGRMLRWMDCIRRTQREFAGMPEMDMASRYYGQGTTVLKVAEAMFVDKQTVNRYRDRYVTYLALLAACEGLIDLTDQEACHG